MENEKNDSANMKCPAVQEIDRSNMLENQLLNDEMDNPDERYKQGMLTEEEGSMVSNLPLLFADGYPTSLEKITMAQLERFILFMVHCSLGHDTTKVINKPEWWPQDVTFSSPLTRPKKRNENWMANLKKLVFRCYTYHRSEYLLRFCSYLAQYPREELEYVNNWDSTTSLYHKSTGKLLVTFRNENMYYDRKIDNARRTLLSRASSVGNKTKQQQQVPMMVEPSDDIYLCDNCDAEFIGLAKMKEHEKICCAEQDQGGSGSRSSSPDLSLISQVELQQDQFLSYFQLVSNKTEEAQSSDVKTANVPDNNIVRRTSQRVRNTVSFTRCATIPFSSPAGMVLAKRSKSIITEDTQQERLDRIERHVVAPVLSHSCRPKWLDTVNCTKWIVTYKPNRDISNNNYVHQYKFGNPLSDKPILDIRSQLLYIACRPIHAVLKRLNEMQIDELKKDPSKYQRFHQKNVNAPKIRPMRKAGPACKTRPRSKTVCGQTTLVSSKRKAEFNDELGSSNSEDGDNAAPTAKALVPSSEVSLSMNDVEATETTTEKDCSSRAIMLIDLCSSDEEEDDLRKPASCDENRDPLNTTTGSSNAKSGLQKLSPKQTLSGNIHLCLSANF